MSVVINSVQSLLEENMCIRTHTHTHIHNMFTGVF